MKDHVMPTKRIGGLLLHHAITWMIFLCTLVCYMERQGFPIAFTVLANHSQLTEEVKGRVLSSFFFGYSAMQVPGGWLAARCGGFRILQVSFALWGLTSLIMPGTVVGRNTAVITGCRMVIGISQGMFIPACHTLLAQWVPVHERSRLVSLAMSGMYLGQGMSMIVFPCIVGHLGPVGEFRCVGLLAFLWLAVWSQVGSDRPETNNTGNGNPKPSTAESQESDENGNRESTGRWTTGDKDTDSLMPKKEEPAQLPLIRGGSMSHSRASSTSLRTSPSPPLETKVNIVTVAGPAVGGGNGGGAKRGVSATASIPWGAMLRSPAVWAIVSTNFAFHYAVYVLMNWLPTYYEKHLNASLLEIGNVFKGAPYFMMFVASNAGGSLGTWANVSRGMTIAFSRKLVSAVGFSLAIVSLCLMPRAKHWGEGVLYTTMALSSLGLCRGGWAVNHMDIAPRHAGVLMAISNAVGTQAGVIGNMMTGKILDAMGGPTEGVAWSMALGVVALVCLASLVTFLTLAKGEVLFF